MLAANVQRKQRQNLSESLGAVKSYSQLAETPESPPFARGSRHRGRWVCSKRRTLVRIEMGRSVRRTVYFSACTRFQERFLFLSLFQVCCREYLGTCRAHLLGFVLFISLSGSSRAARRYFCFWLFDEHSTTLTLSTRAPFRRAHFQLIASFHP
jgi:hypothetical protein